MIEVVAPPTDTLRGSQLESELEAEGYTEVSVAQVGEVLEVYGKVGDQSIGEQSRSKIERVVAAHTPKPPVDVELKRIRDLGRKASKSPDDIHEFMALVAKRVR